MFTSNDNEDIIKKGKKKTHSLRLVSLKDNK